MRKSIPVLVLACVLLPLVTSSAQETSAKPTETSTKPMAPFYTNMSDAKAAAMSKDRPVLVDFYAVW